MKGLIIEDERPAALKLEKLLREVEPDFEVLAKPDSVAKSVEWFRSHPAPDLVFMDIQLGDGLSFEIFEQVAVQCPVIFTTAYDEYAIRAFKVNSIDYLLKPIDKDELKDAFEKYHKIRPGKPGQYVIDQVLKSLTKEYKTRFLVKVGEHIKFFPTNEIQCFYSMEKSSYILTADNRNYDLDYPLDQIELLVDPFSFFRISRKYIVNIRFIRDIIIYSNSRLKVKLEGMLDEKLIVSREKVKNFKTWLDR
ncbi:MAG: LytTR family DNA-binding domain-containing protein [Bacteroidales bacterium]|nr:LytTR family DNA-binding domain-containing protein [Bacteroidales bacterium]MCF8399638.1 LytTR family DNA-binding domain-containing protein [Bacteroidales bacterium]